MPEINNYAQYQMWNDIYVKYFTIFYDTYLLKRCVGLKRVIEDESLQIRSSVGQLQYDIELVLPENFRRVILGTSSLVIQFPQI